MAEPTLNLPLKKLEAEAGRYLGFGRGANYADTTWTARQQADITDGVDAGLRMYYYPPPLPGERAGHDWTFLRPHAAMTLDEGADPPVIPMPDDFAGLEGPLRLFGADRGSWRIEVVDESIVRERFEAEPSKTGRPEMAAVQALRKVSPVGSNTHQLHVFPIADQDYNVLFNYYLNPNALTATYPWAYGGQQHAQTLLAAVRAACEWLKYGERGVEHAMYMDCLATSVGKDRLMTASVLGYNSDPSYNQGRGGIVPHELRHYLPPSSPITWDS